jgi:hypothetical protein
MRSGLFLFRRSSGPPSYFPLSLSLSLSLSPKPTAYASPHSLRYHPP